jgi:glutamyl-tRNA synthetase
MKASNIKVRIAPSPTGSPHIGTAYISLFNYIFAKKYKGKLVLRIENTDKKRSKIKNEKKILIFLKWLGIQWNEGPYRQNERICIYKKYIKLLIEKHYAYCCTCSIYRLQKLKTKQILKKQAFKYDQHCRNNKQIHNLDTKNKKFVIRLKTPNKEKTSFIDLLRGKITIENKNIDDFVLQKSDGYPTYHLASVIDDYLMKISHIIRGEDWISSTPKHIILYKILKFKTPEFIHLPLLRNVDKSKISKRKNNTSFEYFINSGYLPNAICNFLSSISFSFKDNRELFDLNNFIKHFSLKKISLSGPIFDIKKLTWINAQYLKNKYNNNEIVSYIQKQLFSKKYLKKIIPLIRNRINKSDDFINHADYFFTNKIKIKIENFLIKSLNLNQNIFFYQKLLNNITSLNNFSIKKIKNAFYKISKKKNIKKGILLISVRFIIIGKKNTPPLFEIMHTIGMERCKTRFLNAINLLIKEKNN